jgi:hypothetical protein
MQAIRKLSEVASEKKKKKKAKRDKENKKVQTAKAKMLEASWKMISKKRSQKIKENAPLRGEA